MWCRGQWAVGVEHVEKAAIAISDKADSIDLGVHGGNQIMDPADVDVFGKKGRCAGRAFSGSEEQKLLYLCGEE
jgi:hypothetical protein